MEKVPEAGGTAAISEFACDGCHCLSHWSLKYTEWKRKEITFDDSDSEIDASPLRAKKFNGNTNRRMEISKSQ